MNYRLYYVKVENCVVVSNIIYGKYDSVSDAAEQIMREVIGVRDGVGYFSHFDEKRDSDGELLFDWFSNIGDVDRVAEFRQMWIAEKACLNGTYLEWHIIRDDEKSGVLNII